MASREASDGPPGGGGGGGSSAPSSRGVSPEGRASGSRECSEGGGAPRDGGGYRAGKGAASGAKSGAGRSEAELLASLREEVTRLGMALPQGWTCVVKPRGGDIAKGCDPYYISPSGRRFRSRQEVRAAPLRAPRRAAAARQMRKNPCCFAGFCFARRQRGGASHRRRRRVVCAARRCCARWASPASRARRRTSAPRRRWRTRRCR
jgi:hypothetical protein